MDLKKKLVCVFMTILIVGGTLSLEKVSATSYEETVVRFDESTSQSQEKTIQLSKEAILWSVTVDSGRVTWNRLDDRMSLSVSGGKSTGVSARLPRDCL